MAWFNWKASVGVSALLIGGVLMLGESQAIAGYVPPQDARPPKTASTTTGVRRGCTSDGEARIDAQLTAIAPRTHVGLSSRERPSFVWFMPERGSFSMEFELYEVDSEGQPAKNLVRHPLVSQPGWSQFELPLETALLLPDQSYLWQVIVYCNPNRPSSALVAAGEIEVQPRPIAQPSAASELQQAQAWAEMGYWYDAIAWAVSSSQPEAKPLRDELIRDLIQLEQEGEAEREKQTGEAIDAEEPLSIQLLKVLQAGL